MESPIELLLQVFTFGLVIAGLVVAWLINVALGGWRVGKFLRCVEFTLDRAQLSGFTGRLYQRLSELGFAPTGIEGQFLQGGVQIQDVGAFTHAKTPKLLTVTLNYPNQSQARVQLAVQYQNMIVADTGEGNYRDAVLDYVSGQTDVMKVVPSRSFMAVCALVGGIFAWFPLLGSVAFGFRGFFQPVLVLGFTNFCLGLYAIVAIARKSHQATGLAWAIAGVIISSSALVAAALLRLLNH